MPRDSGSNHRKDRSISAEKKTNKTVELSFFKNYLGAGFSEIFSEIFPSCAVRKGRGR